ncbi:E3 SUMO-protein ligase SIZ1-like [Hordeum vulgare subsp. vulgare]|nr:E3 SUMO-protein ligase SIZ1-like [Hordeum vulgare subsp. vulgare]
MGDLASTCKDKLAYFRIKELKDVLIHLSLPKHGKKQELVDRILALLSDDQAQWHLGRGRRNAPSKDAVLKIVDDIYSRKMQVHGPPDLVSHHQLPVPDFNRIIKAKKEQDQLGPDSGCLCGQSFVLGNVVKCDDCHVQQHMDCVLIPDKPTVGVRPEAPQHFYCQLCRLSRADPYWVTTGNPLLPVRLITNDGMNVPQSVDRTFLLTRAERETVQRVEYDIQVWCMLLNDKVQFRMHWPQNADLQVNGIQVRVVPRPSTQLLGINGRDDGPVITTFCREGQNKIVLSSDDARPFCFGIRIAKRRTVDQVRNLVPKEADGESFEDSLARVCRCLRGGNTTDDADSDSDLEVVADFFPVSLRCPNSGSRIRTAGRFKPCAHMGSFDLQTFVELNQRSRKWQCPTCLKNYSIESLIIDRYFNRIASLVRNCSEDVTEIDVKPDGSWRVKGDVEDIKLSLWHLPDGSLCELKQDAKPVTGDVKSETSKIGSKGNLGLNGLWEASKAVDIKPSKPVSSSHTGIYRDGDYLSVSECSTQIGEMYRVDDRPQQQLEDADVIVLSDSDDDNVVTVSPPAAYSDVGGLGFAPISAPGVAESYQEGGVVGGLGLDLFNDNSDIFDITSWSAQPQPEQGFNFFGTDILLGSHNSSGAASNGYTLNCHAGSSDTSRVPDPSTCHVRTRSLVDNLLPFGNDDSSLRIFLPIQPSGVPVQEERNVHDDMANAVQPDDDDEDDDWISLTLAAGGGSNEQFEAADTVSPQAQIAVEERRMEPAETLNLHAQTTVEERRMEPADMLNPQAQISVEETRMEPADTLNPQAQITVEGTEPADTLSPQAQVTVEERRMEPADTVNPPQAQISVEERRMEPADTLNPQARIAVEERRTEPLGDAEGSHVGLNDGRHSKEKSKTRAEKIFSPPRQPRSVRPRLTTQQ